MEFTIFHKDYFNAIQGAFSRVTSRENFDSQITLTDVEAEIVIRHFGIENINLGNVASDRAKSSKRFLLYPELNPIDLNLVFPKPTKLELRLYISSKSGFKPLPNEIWFLYENENHELIIGSLPENIWGNIGQEDFIDPEYQDKIEETLLSSVNINISPEGKINTTIRNRQTIYVRDPRLAIMRFNAANYTCEIDRTHKTFIAESTKFPFMEAHHFIPIKFQNHFEIPLDNFYNIISLCPNCHRGIHHGVIDYKYEMISNLYNKRKEIQNYSLESIAEYYNCIKVPVE